MHALASLPQGVELMSGANALVGLVKDGEKVKLVFNDGHEIAVGNLSAGGLGTMYTKLRNNKKTNTFIFTEERDEVGFIARLAGLRK